jgi:hypothetical protein
MYHIITRKNEIDYKKKKKIIIIIIIQGFSRYLTLGGANFEIFEKLRSGRIKLIRLSR